MPPPPPPIARPVAIIRNAEGHVQLIEDPNGTAISTSSTSLAGELIAVHGLNNKCSESEFLFSVLH